MNSTKYVNYKQSEIEWLDVIPEHWKINRLKYTSEIQVSNVDKHTLDEQQKVYLCNYTDVYKNDFINSDLNFMLASATSEQIKKFTLKQGNVIITKDSETPDDIGIPAFVTENLPETVCGYHLALIKTNNEKVSGRFLHRYLQSHLPKAYFYTEANGITRFGLGKQSINDLPVILPSLEEQEAIAEMLDRETALLDNLIAEKESLLKLLAEKRRTLITHAVIRGINSKAKLVDSGIEWIGQIPQHWKTPPVYARYDVQLGKMLDEKQIKGNQLGKYLRNIDVQWGKINIENLPEMDFDFDDRKKFSLKFGDILVCEGGEIGRTAIWKYNFENFYYQKALHRLRPKSKNDLPEYFLYVMHALVDLGVFISMSTASTIHHLPAEKLKIVRYPLPPIEEQKQIVDYIEAETNKIDRLQEATKSTIELLKERRASLITAAVTGKIQVNEMK